TNHIIIENLNKPFPDRFGIVPNPKAEEWQIITKRNYEPSGKLYQYTFQFKSNSKHITKTVKAINNSVILRLLAENLRINKNINIMDIDKNNNYLSKSWSLFLSIMIALNPSLSVNQI